RSGPVWYSCSCESGGSPRLGSVGVLRGVIAEVALAKEGGPVVEVGERDVGVDPRGFQGSDVLGGAIGRISGDLTRTDPKAEERAPHHVLLRLILSHRPRSCQHMPYTTLFRLG